MTKVMHSEGQERLSYLREIAKDAATLKQLTETASHQSLQLLAKSADVSLPTNRLIDLVYLQRTHIM